MLIELQDEYITLSQLLKVCNIVSSGGEAKAYLAQETVLVNGEKDDRRGWKIRSGDTVETGRKIIHIQ